MLNVIVKTTPTAYAVKVDDSVAMATNWSKDC